MQYKAALIILWLIPILGSCQLCTILGRVTDSSGKKAIPLTTITIFRANDTTVLTYRLTSETGAFKIPDLPYRVPLRLMATYSGFEAFRKDFFLSNENPKIDFGTIKLIGTSKQLDDVIVYAERPPVVIRSDTIEFNASSFKTLPEALLEDLLMKLPGIQVGENGDIVVNGQKVNRILVDGKRFFGDNPKMATKNLPSNMVDKIQVMDDKDEIAQNNDGDMSRIGKIINVTLKKNIKKALFGKLYAGGGTNERYESGAIINTFRDTLQLSLLAYRNNINRTAFNISDILSLGGFNRGSQISNMSINNGAFTVNNISFGGGNNGISTSTGAGININHSPSKSLNVYAQYFYGNSNTDNYINQNTQRRFGDTILFGETMSNSISLSNSHTVNVGGNWHDSLTNVNFSSGFVYLLNQANSYSTGTIQNNKYGAASNFSGLNNINGSSSAYNYSVSLSHRFSGKRSRIISVTHKFNYLHNPVDNINESINNYLFPGTFTLIVQQMRSTNSPSTFANLITNYSDRISKKLSLKINQSIEFSKQAQLIGIYSKHASTGFYDSLNTLISNDLWREQILWNNQFTLGFQINKVQLNFGATLFQQWISNQYAKGINSQLHYSNLLLNAGLNWKKINIGLSTNATAPTINYLNPVVDNSNPFYVVNGNPNLHQSRQTNLRINGTIFKLKNNYSFNFNLNGVVENDAVVQSLIVNSNGAQISTPINVNGVQRLNARIAVNKQFKKSPKFTFSADISLLGQLNKVPVMFNNVLSGTNSYLILPVVKFNFNWHDLVEFSPTANVNFRKNTYSSPLFTSTEYATKYISGEFIVRLPKKLVWETNLTYRYISNLTPGIPKTNVYWNAALTFLMFKENKGQLRLAIYDILRSNNNSSRVISDNLITDLKGMVLKRYFMVTYSYNIRSLLGKTTKVGGNQQSGLFRF